MHRRDVDNAPPISLGDHLTGGLLAADPDPREVDGDHLLPDVQWCLEKGELLFYTGVVDHDVEAAELLDGLLDQAPHFLRLGDIGLNRDGLAPDLLYLLDRTFPFFRVTPVVDGHRGSLPPESDGDGPADPQGRACDYSDLIL